MKQSLIFHLPQWIEVNQWKEFIYFNYLRYLILWAMDLLLVASSYITDYSLTQKSTLCTILKLTTNRSSAGSLDLCMRKDVKCQSRGACFIPGPSSKTDW